MKKVFCTICKSLPNIKINVLNYCNMCFIKQFEAKIFKNMRNLPYQSKILILIKKKSDLLLPNVINQMKNKKLYFFEIFSTFEYKKNFDFTSVLDINKNLNINKYKFEVETKKILAYDDINFYNTIINKSINVVLHTKTVEEICRNIFKDVLNGKSLTDIIIEKNNIVQNVLFLNVFDGIKNKELQYYLYLHKNIAYVPSKNNETFQIISTNFENLNLSNQTSQLSSKIHNSANFDKKQKAIDKFIFEIDKNNTLAFFNIINTIKKL